LDVLGATIARRVTLRSSAHTVTAFAGVSNDELAKAKKYVLSRAFCVVVF